MGKKMKLPFILKNTADVKASWPWPSCNQPRTLSFRNNNEIFKTINSAFLDATVVAADTTDPSLFTKSSSESTSLSTASEDSRRGEDPIESVIRGLRSERLFFEPEETSSILESKLSVAGLPFKESVILSIESKDPFVDFCKSMEEMVEAHGVKDWEGLEELLSCYLRVNGKSNHGYIVGAFVDLLTGLALSRTRPCPCSCLAGCSDHSPSSPLSFDTSSSASYSSSTPCLSCVELEEEEPGTPSSYNSLTLQVKKVDTGSNDDEASSSSSSSNV